MSYKTILVHVDKSRRVNERIRLAAAIAHDESAHLVGSAATGISRYIYQSSMMGDGMAYSAHIEAHMDLLRTQCKQALHDFEEAARMTNIRSFEARLMDDEAGAGLSLQGRYSDLLVLGQTNFDDPMSSTMPDLPEYVVLNSGRPVLIVPYAGRFDAVGKRVLVAWDASISATRAVTAALPLLRRADVVEVVVFNADDQDDAHGEQPGADIALYLARHDVNVNVTRQKSKSDIGSALLSMTNDLASELIVMGGYGHSRFREILLGGVTRTVLESMTVPVLMTH